MIAHSSVESVDGGRVALRVVAVESVARPGPRFVLAQALAKGGRDEQAIETATELGVDEVIAWQAERSIVRWSGKETKALAKWTGVVRAAGKQSRRATLPTVSGLVSSAGLADRAGGCALALVLHEEADRPLTEVTLPDSGDVLVAVGPEGGIAPAELDRLAAAGAVPVRLGPGCCVPPVQARRHWRSWCHEPGGDRGFGRRDERCRVTAARSTGWSWRRRRGPRAPGWAARTGWSRCG